MRITEKLSRYGNRHLRIGAELKFGKKKYKVNQRCYRAKKINGEWVPDKLGTVWALNKTQAIGLLKEAPEKFQIRRIHHFNGMIDGIEYDDSEFEELTPRRLTALLDELTFFKKSPYLYSYDEETKTFKISCHYLSSWELPVEGVSIS